MSFALVAGFFLFVMAAVTGAGYLFTRLRAASASDQLPPGSEDDWQQVAAAVLSRLGGWTTRPGARFDSLRKQLFRAGYRTAPALQIFNGLQVAIAAALGIGVAWAASAAKGSLPDALIPAVCAAGFGFFLPSRVLDYQVKARANRMRQAVPPAIDLLVLALEAGQSLDQAMIDTAVSLRSAYPDICSEFIFTHLEMRAGTSKQEALRHLAERSGEEELRKLAVLLIDGERFGTSLGPALRTHGRYLRTRMRQLAQEAARKLTVKLVIPVFFLIFPSVLLVTLGPAYLQMRTFLDSFLK
jgi:tight adherence protein C